MISKKDHTEGIFPSESDLAIKIFRVIWIFDAAYNYPVMFSKDFEISKHPVSQHLTLTAKDLIKCVNLYLVKNLITKDQIEFILTMAMNCTLIQRSEITDEDGKRISYRKAIAGSLQE